MRARPEAAQEYPWPERIPGTGRTYFPVQLSIAIQDLRKARPWSPKELADRAHVAESTIRSIEKGDRGVGEEVQSRIAFAFGMQPSEGSAVAEGITHARCQQIVCERRLREAEKEARKAAQ